MAGSGTSAKRESMNVIPFEPRRFQSAAASYLEGRPAYPAKLFRRVAELCRLDRTHRLLDLGCGPGQIAVALAPYVGHVVAVDPEPEMLKIAGELAAEAGQAIELIEGSSYDLGPRFGRFRMVTMGRSFHWMDRAVTLQLLDEMIEPEGAVVLLRDDHPDVPDNAWHKPFREILHRYSADDIAKQMRSSWINHEGVLLESAFRQLEQIAVYDRRPLSVEALVLRTASMSTVSRSRIGSKADDLAAEVRDAMVPFAAEGMFHEVTVSSALIASRP
jgi:ubiquinone/menaquinone biosynthesis C-methylase UbiE